MKSVSPLDFGLFIAYLVPGFIAFYAITYIVPEAKAVFTYSLTPKSGVSAELGIGLFSIGVGIIVSAVRDLVLDFIQFKTGVVKPTLDMSKLGKEGVQNAFNAAINNTWRFAQFYGNMFISVLILSPFMIEFSKSFEKWLINFVFIVSLLVLFIAHRKQLKQTYETLEQILK